MLNRRTAEQRLHIAITNGSIGLTNRALRIIFGRHNRPADSVIRETLDWFTLVHNAHPQRCHRVEYRRRPE